MVIQEIIKFYLRRSMKVCRNPGHPVVKNNTATIPLLDKEILGDK